MTVKIGEFYQKLKENRGDSADLANCITETVQKLLDLDTSIQKPGMLLGKIQSGKTRAFLGAMALAFDNGYDVAVVLTKGTVALAEQTYQRILEDFSYFIDEDRLQVHDIMHFPKNLTPYELQQKVVIIAKKEINNLKRVIRALVETYPDLRNKKLLIIDDEADFASINFIKRKKDEVASEAVVEQGKIATQIDELRKKVSTSDFLQVTATPYSLYLQPDDEVVNLSSVEFKPKRPAFTVLVPIHDDYVGGDYYFSESSNEGSTAYCTFEEVPIEERDALKKDDRRGFKVEEVLTAKKIGVLRHAVMNFIVGGSIRMLQEPATSKKYSFIIHTERAKTSHSWQEDIINALMVALDEAANEDAKLLNTLIEESYLDLKRCAHLSAIPFPDLQAVINKVYAVLKSGFVMVTTVNSERDVKELLDSKGQLKLRTPFNVFIGGQILDRGITIRNLIGFYYGRNPQRFQQDTVLQHSRMYGARLRADLLVTRFYTTRNLYEVMGRIHEFDSALRTAFERGSQDDGVIFLRKDAENKIIPCSPNKILISKITTLRPSKRLLPVGFQTDFKGHAADTLKMLDKEIDALVTASAGHDPFLVDLDNVMVVIDLIQQTLFFEDGYEWDIKAFRSSLEYLSKNAANPERRGKVWVMVRKDRNTSRFKGGGVFSDSPESGETIGLKAKEAAVDIPALILLRQNGLKEQDWKSPFWWPVVIAPKNTKVSIFASDTIDEP